jgi:hypothetical protein
MRLKDLLGIRGTLADRQAASLLRIPDRFTLKEPLQPSSTWPAMHRDAAATSADATPWPPGWWS